MHPSQFLTTNCLTLALNLHRRHLHIRRHRTGLNLRQRLLMQIIRQRTQCSLTKQQIYILQTNLFRLFEEEEDDREGDTEVPCFGPSAFIM
jgi:hypothetical protein